MIFMHFYLQKHAKVEDAELKKAREDLQNRVDFLRKQADVSASMLGLVLLSNSLLHEFLLISYGNHVSLCQSYDDKGPVIDAVVWHDGELWRVAIDTQSLEDDPECGKLANFTPLTNYK